MITLAPEQLQEVVEWFQGLGDSMKDDDTLPFEHACPAKPSGLSGTGRWGGPGVPLILAELERETNVSWFNVLVAIMGEGPGPPALAGRVDAMAQPWLDWGRQGGDTMSAKLDKAFPNLAVAA